jgi:UDP-2,3-diacylglucosamine pyrophosphatase LpxH
MTTQHEASEKVSHKTYYRSVWISDAHLCCRDAQADCLYDFLDSMRCENLYLVGDIIDIWSLRRKWHWTSQYNDVIHKMLKCARRGARVVYIPGNHDDFFRSYVGYNLGGIEVALNTVHETLEGKRYLVVHGDEFDTVVQYHRWLSHLGSWAYGHLITLNRLVNVVRRRMGKPHWSLSGAVKRRVKKAVKLVNRFESVLSAAAKRQGVDGVICGHIHQPAMYDIDGVHYCNTGDWVESCTALVEDERGRLSLLNWRNEFDAKMLSEQSRGTRFEAAAEELLST